VPNGIFGAQIGGSTSITEEQKKQIVERAQKVVNDVQIRQLSDIIGLLDGILDDPQKQYYILIDRLDEDWIEDTLRYRLIRALIETVRDFRKIRHAKIIVAIRQDLLDRVFRLIRGSGFQEEKYESLYVYVRWTDRQLLEIMNIRLNCLIKHRYTKQPMGMDHLLPQSIDKQKPSEYIISRTLKQPRDAIHFVNKCIEQVMNKKSITVKAIKEAEGEYSRDRLRYLADEWTSDCPNLLEFVKVLRKQPVRFPIQALNKACEEFCLNFTCNNLGSSEPKYANSYLSQLAFRTAHGYSDLNLFRNSLIQTFYKVGMLGVKIDTYESFIWSSSQRRGISGTEINNNTKLEVHPAFWRVLGTLNKKG